jgi:hypothetical protein
VWRRTWRLGATPTPGGLSIRREVSGGSAGRSGVGVCRGLCRERVVVGGVVGAGDVLRWAGPQGRVLSGGAGQSARGSEQPGEGVGPGPSGGHAEGVTAGAVDGDRGNGSDAGPERDAGGGWLIAEEAGPADEVVGDHVAGEPGGVGGAVAGGDVFDAAGFEVADGEFDDGVVAVEGVGFDGVEVDAVGDERVVSPFGEQPELGCVGERVRRTTRRTVRTLGVLRLPTV